MAFTDKFIGFMMMLASAVIFLYYSAWVLIVPLLEKDTKISKYFPPQMYAIFIPTVLLVVAVVLVTVFFGYVSIKESRKQKSQ